MPPDLLPDQSYSRAVRRNASRFGTKEPVARADMLRKTEELLQVVPGLPMEQWLWTLTTSILGGLIAGFAAYPRKQEETIAWAWLLLLSPLWVMLFGVFGIAPVITRTSEALPLIRNCVGFLGGGIAAYLIAGITVGRPRESESES